MRGVKKRICLFVLIVAQLLLGCLRAEQAGPTVSPATPAQKTPVQQLSEILEPFKVQVTSSSLSTPENTGTRELRLRWTSGTASTTPDAPKPGPPPQGAFSVFRQQRYSEAPPRQRTLNLAPDRLLIAGVDSKGQLKSWTVMVDPRIVRSEGPGPDGTLTGQTLHMEQTEFFVSVPDDPAIVEVRLYEAQPDGRSFKLGQVGVVSLNR